MRNTGPQPSLQMLGQVLRTDWGRIARVVRGIVLNGPVAANGLSQTDVHQTNGERRPGPGTGTGEKEMKKLLVLAVGSLFVASVAVACPGGGAGDKGQKTADGKTKTETKDKKTTT